jgi:hypothetical protein
LTLNQTRGFCDLPFDHFLQSIDQNLAYAICENPDRNVNDQINGNLNNGFVDVAKSCLVVVDLESECFDEVRNNGIEA